MTPLPKSNRLGPPRAGRNPREPRRAAFTAVACACLVGAISFAALSVDIGMIAMTKSRLQSSADAAALAAAQEMTNVVQQAGQSGGQHVEPAGTDRNRRAGDGGESRGSERRIC